MSAAAAAAAKSLQSCLTLCDPIDGRSGVREIHSRLHQPSEQLSNFKVKYFLLYFQRNNASLMRVHREIYFQELAHMIAEAGKPQICRVGLQAGDSGRS